jgi:hypothetical protein
MVAHMKTTIEIADDLLARAKRQARKERKTLRAIVDDALRQRLDGPRPASAFTLKRHPMRGQGRSPLVPEGQWEVVRDLIHRLG